MKVHRRPEEFVALQFTGGSRVGSVEVRPTWPGRGSEPSDTMPYEQESARQRHGHHLVWDLHKEGFSHWVSTLNDIVGVREGDWIIFHDGSEIAEDVVPDEAFRRLYEEHR